MQLRWYQKEAVSEFFAAAKKYPKDDLLEVLPTGAGKTIVLSGISAQVLELGGRVMVLARTKELLAQGQARFCEAFPHLADRSGVYCAGLGLKEFDKDIVFASVQSAYSKPELFGKRKLLIIDEAHQVPANEESQYQTLLSGLKLAEPTCKLLGLTASPYRLDGGVIFGKSQQFDRVCYNVPLSVLFAEGYITRPKTLDVTKVDLSGVKRTAGDFNKADVQSRFLGNSITSEFLACCNDKDAKSVLIFASGIAHAEVIKGELEKAGEHADIVTGDTPPLFRQAVIDKFSAGKTRFLVNCEVLTTGFDATCIDAVVVARATESAGLFLQMVGRGFRLHEGKRVCWIMDSGGNIDRHGPIDSDEYGVNTIKPASKGTGEAPTRICPKCFSENALGAKYCIKCGLEFPKVEKQLVATARSIVAEPVVLSVEDVWYSRWKGKDGKRDTMRVDYKCTDPESVMGRRRVSEWVCLEHEGFARSKAIQWWETHSNNNFPGSIDEALEIINVIGVGQPSEIKVVREGKFDRVLSWNVPEKPAAKPADWGIPDEEMPF